MGCRRNRGITGEPSAVSICERGNEVTDEKSNQDKIRRSKGSRRSATIPGTRWSSRFGRRRTVGDESTEFAAGAEKEKRTRAAM
jgi:hypothetical protein